MSGGNDFAEETAGFTDSGFAVAEKHLTGRQGSSSFVETLRIVKCR
jgi:hypothetical protein